jgi:hypothetical protein
MMKRVNLDASSLPLQFTDVMFPYFQSLVMQPSAFKSSSASVKYKITGGAESCQSKYFFILRPITKASRNIKTMG